MLSLTLFGVAFAGCGLSTDIDPNGACVTDDNGYSTLDADSAGVPMSLTISSKSAHTDHAKDDHPATAGALDLDAGNGRYILACKQAEDVKTVQMSVTRPADMTAFGAEWVQLFPKDSWLNVTNEYEPFSFNDYGAKVPLFRATTTTLANDAPNEGVLHVYMEVSEEGDYEVMYGNPGLQYDDKWVAVQFKSTLLRVGTPWAECSGTTLGAESYSVGSIMPVLFGGPNLNSIAAPDDAPNYEDVISELDGVSVPVKVVLEIFNADKTSYTDSTNTDGVYSVCYKAGNACPEGHLVCQASYCEMDVWKSIIADFKAAGTVTVLGSVDSAATQALYAGLDLDGFYFTTAAVPAGYTGTSVLALGRLCVRLPCRPPTCAGEEFGEKSDSPPLPLPPLPLIDLTNKPAVVAGVDSPRLKARLLDLRPSVVVQGDDSTAVLGVVVNASFRLRSFMPEPQGLEQLLQSFQSDHMQ